MFQKEFVIKSTISVKKAEREKFKAQMLKTFDMTENQLESILSKKLTQMKIITHNNNVVRLYCVQDVAIVFESKGKLYPTVFMVWIYSQIVPRLKINENVKPNFFVSVEIECRDLICEENNELLTLLSDNQCVSVYSTSSKKIIGVGHKKVNKSHLQNENDNHIINVLHYYNDELFKLFAGMEKTPDTIKAMRKEIKKTLKLKNNLENLSESRNRVFLKKMDQIVMTCFLKALKQFVKEDMLPLLANEFYKKHVVPFDSEGIKIDIKETSYKKLSNLLQSLEEQGFIKCSKELDGIPLIIDINYNLIHKEIDLQHNLEINDLPVDKETNKQDNLCFLPNHNETTCSIPDMEIAYDNNTTIDIAFQFTKNYRKITLVNNLEVYGVDIEKFKKKCQHGVAASTTIHNFPSKENRQVLVQGCHVLFVFELLTEQYKIPPKYVRGHEGYIRCATLVVLNLPYHFNENNLKEYFGKFGSLLIAEIQRDECGQSRGAGFIRYSNLESQVYVLSNVHNMYGRNIFVKLQSKSKVLKNPKPIGTVFMSGLTEDLSADDIHKYFSMFGEVITVFIPTVPFRGYAFVSFSDPEVAASLCGDIFHLKGVLIKVSEKKQKPKNLQQVIESQDKVTDVV